MKPGYKMRQYDVPPDAVSAARGAARIASDADAPAPANEPRMSARRERAVDPLWMIVAAMAIEFALLLMLATFD